MLCGLVDEHNTASLWNWKRGCLVLHVLNLFAVFVVGAYHAWDFTIDVYMSTIDVAGQDRRFRSEHQSVGSVRLFGVYLCVPLVTTMHYVLTLLFWDSNGPWRAFAYLPSRDQGFSPVRWMEYSITASLMTVSVALLCCVTDVAALCGLVSVNIAVQGFGHMSEWAQSVTPHYDSFIWATVVFSLSWGTSIVTYFLYNVSKNAAVPDFVYATVLLLTVLYASFPIVHVRHIRKDITYARADVYYDVLSFVSKVTLDWLILGGMMGW
jgi:hypothetical protein